MLSGHVMFTALVPYCFFISALCCFNIDKTILVSWRWYKEFSRDHAKLCARLVLKVVPYLWVFIFSFHSPSACSECVNLLLSYSYWCKSVNVKNKEWHLYHIAVGSVKNNCLQDLYTPMALIECMSVFTMKCERWCFNIAMNWKLTYIPSACLHLCLTKDSIEGHFLISFFFLYVISLGIVL